MVEERSRWMGAEPPIRGNSMCAGLEGRRGEGLAYQEAEPGGPVLRMMGSQEMNFCCCLAEEAVCHLEQERSNTS